MLPRAVGGCDELKMPIRTVQIRIVCRPPDQFDLIHRLRNYGEDVYRYTRDNGMGQVDLDEVDSAKDQFSVRGVANSKVRRLCRWLEKEGSRQNLQIATTVG